MGCNVIQFILLLFVGLLFCYFNIDSLKRFLKSWDIIFPSFQFPRVIIYFLISEILFNKYLNFIINYISI